MKRLPWLLWEHPTRENERAELRSTPRQPLHFNLEIPYFAPGPYGREGDWIRIIEEEVDFAGEPIGFHIMEPVRIGNVSSWTDVVTFLLTTVPRRGHSYGRAGWLLPPMEILFDLRKLEHEDRADLRDSTRGGTWDESQEPDRFLMVIPGLLEAHNLLVRGQGVQYKPRGGVLLTPELAVDLDHWLTET